MISKEQILSAIKNKWEVAETEKLIMIGKKQALEELDDYFRNFYGETGDCTSCKWENVNRDKLPCVACSQNYLSRWEKADNA